MGVIYQDYISCQAYSQCTIFGCLGVLPEVLYHFCGSAPTRVVRETCLLIREYSQCLLGPFLWEHSHKHGIAVLGVLPKTQNNYYWEYSQICLKSGRSNLWKGGGAGGVRYIRTYLVINHKNMNILRIENLNCSNLLN